MRTSSKWAALCAMLACTLAFTGAQAFGGTALGFGVAVPAALPVTLQDSFSFLAAEAGADTNMSLRLAVGTYPASFPDAYLADATLLVKAWASCALLYEGCGLSLEWRRIGDAWLWTPLMNVLWGVQLWMTDSVAVFCEVRSLDELPPRLVLAPEVSLGINLGLGTVRPAPGWINAYYLWVLVGLGVGALLLYYPRI